MNFAETEEKKTKTEDSMKSDELIEKLEIENETLVISLKSLYHENTIAKTEIAEERDRASKAEKTLETVQKERDGYKTQRDKISRILKITLAKYKILKQAAIESKRRKNVVILLSLALAIAVAFSFWSTIKVSKIKSFTQDLKTIVEESALSIDQIPDSIRYDYEYLFKNKW